MNKNKFRKELGKTNVKPFLFRKFFCVLETGADSQTLDLLKFGGGGHTAEKI